ncbi:FAD-binding protein [Pusillimonas sp. CC-YST705]|uniref:FAD-binding protein n=1 Tax=Mesopusillimonas faecipullorum TaxID=2755040 RepID=A0ABS8CFL2_9BURK|nr:FAD-binding protein [Mesopusillimonas faecipullorum]MCB5364594.1 FAD-binding protein [Mesopusillimonas faecipullorum]
MNQPSPFRRAFLMGRRARRHPWEAFIRSLQGQVQGEVLDFGWHGGSGRASWTPIDDSDVATAAALCREYGILLALDGLDYVNTLSNESVLWVVPQSPIAACQVMPGPTRRWLVQPGCLVAQARAAGLMQFEAQYDYLTVAAWLADRRICAWPTGQTAHSGLMLANVLLADGSSAVLGPFGANSQASLDTLFLQRAIPQLFQLSNGLLAQTCQENSTWPARYRLDAMKPQAPQQVNLAHLLLGHGGDLAWVQWMVFEPVPVLPQINTSEPFRAPETLADDDAVALAATELDAAVKALFDPVGLFPHPGQQLD